MIFISPGFSWRLIGLKISKCNLLTNVHNFLLILLHVFFPWLRLLLLLVIGTWLLCIVTSPRSCSCLVSLTALWFRIRWIQIQYFSWILIRRAGGGGGSVHWHMIHAKNKVATFLQVHWKNIKESFFFIFLAPGSRYGSGSTNQIVSGSATLVSHKTSC
jgi:hypothetical protein